MCSPVARIWEPEKWIQFSQPDRVAHTSAPNHRSRRQRLRFLISQVTANQRTKNSWVLKQKMPPEAASFWTY